MSISIIIILVILLNINTNNELIKCRNKLERIHKSNYMDSVLKNVLFNVEGLQIKNLKLKNIRGQTMFNNLLTNYEYYIIAYQNGIVCDPCFEFLISNWNIINPNLNEKLSKKIIIISDKFDRSALIFLKKVQFEDSYFIDINKGIPKILKNDFPTNFLFFIDKKRQIIYSSYFTYDTKEIFIKFIKKVNRYIENK